MAREWLLAILLSGAGIGIGPLKRRESRFELEFLPRSQKALRQSKVERTRS